MLLSRLFLLLAGSGLPRLLLLRRRRRALRLLLLLLPPLLLLRLLASHQAAPYLHNARRLQHPQRVQQLCSRRQGGRSGCGRGAGSRAVTPSSRRWRPSG